MVASKNPDKVREVEAVLAESKGEPLEVVRGLDWPDVDEPFATLEQNALHKAHTVAEATGLIALADDTGLEVDALGGAPGVHTARFAGPDASYAENVARLLADLEGVENRSATFRTVVAVAWPDGADLWAEGALAGRIARSRRGTFGFGYDPVEERDFQTLAEIPEAEKNRISHRARALAGALSGLRGSHAQD